MNFIDKIKLRKKQSLLRERSVLVNRTSEIHHQVLRVCITYHCNRDCSFCYSQGLQEEFKEHMSLSDFEFLCRWMKPQGFKSIRLLGGEPTVHPEFGAILDIARKHGYTVSLSTNGFFNEGLNSFFDKNLIESINFSYPQDSLKSQEKQRFGQNIKDVIHKDIPVVISGVIYHDRDDWIKVIDLAKDFRTKVIARFSMVLPGYARHFAPEEFCDHIKELARQALSIARYAYKNYVVFYFYRPFLLCMFTPQENRFLKSISPNLFDGVCSCSCVDGAMLTVNPDLSCSPCPSFFLKGIKITPEISRETICQDFKAKMKQLSTQPLMDSCQTCQFFINYKLRLEDKSQDFSNEQLCHGGCFQYRA